MPRLKPVTLTKDERSKLAAWSRRPKTAQRLALRARIVLAAADGRTNTAIATDLRVTLPTVGKWRQRFLDRRHRQTNWNGWSAPLRSKDAVHPCEKPCRT